MAKAQGNLAQTAGSAANQIKSLGGRFENLKTAIGTSLVGFLIPVLEDANVLIEVIKNAWSSTEFAARNASVGVVGAVQKQNTGLGWLQRGIMFLADAWQTFKVKALEAIQSAVSGIYKLLGGLYPVAKELDAIAGAFGLKGSKLTAGLGDAQVSVMKLSNELSKLHQQEVAMPAPSGGIAKAFQKGREQIEAARKQLDLQGKLDVNASAPVERAWRQRARPRPRRTNSRRWPWRDREATNAILKGQYGGGVGKTAADATAKNTGETVKAVQALTAAVKAGSMLGALWLRLCPMRGAGSEP